MRYRVGNQSTSFKRCVWLGLLATVPLFYQVHGQERDVPDAQADRVAEFRLEATDGRKISLAVNKDDQLTVVCFLGIECPLAKLYAPRLAALAKEYSDRSVRFIGVNSNQQDSMQEFTEFAAGQNIKFDCVKDYDNVVADLWRVTRTPEVVVVDQDLKVKYRGRIDDQYLPGVARNKPQREDLRLALDELLAGKQVTVSITKPEGCLLGRIKKPVANATVTYADQVSRILQSNCLECHRDGEIGPFSMEEYEEVVGWADMMLETIDNGRMPPWHAADSPRKFRNERRLSESDKQLIRQWVADGAPLGDRQRLPAKKVFTTGWRLPREPDLVVEMSDRPFQIPADGTVEYQYFVVDPGFEKDKWVSAAEVIPGSRSVVHHSIVFIRPPDGASVRGVGWLAAYVPGQKNLEFSPQMARRIPAGSKLVFQQHYTPNGSDQKDLTKIGLVFADEADVKEELLTLIALDQQFEVRPNERDHTVEAALPWFPRNGRLLSISPHMHYRGKSFVAAMTTRQQENLLTVPNYDFNWQHIYEFVEPISLQEVEELTIAVTFDNSAENPFNPDPSQYVTWGDQTWEEMAIGFFNVAVSRENDAAVGNGEANTDPASDANMPNKVETERIVKSFFDRFDGNGDGVIVRNELPMSIAHWAFEDYDQNYDAELTREEIRQQVEDRLRD